MKNATLLLVHGAGNNNSVWEELLRHIPVESIPLELPGHGKTPGEGMESIEEYARWVSERARELGKESVVLAGHSMGGAIVQRVMGDNPKWLKGSILISTGARLKVNPAIIEGLKQDFSGMCRKIAGWAVAKDSPKEVVDRVASVFCSARPDVVIKDFVACHNFRGEEFCRRAQVPALIVVGSKDVMTPPKLSQELAELIGEARLEVIEGAGHMLQVERPQELARLMVDFIESL